MLSQLNRFIDPEFSQIILQVLPELSLLCFAVLILVFDAFLPRINRLNLSSSKIANNAANLPRDLEFIDNLQFKNYKITFWLFNISLLLVIYFICYQHNFLATNDTLYSPVVDKLIGHMVVNDSLSFILKFFMAVFVLVSFYYSKNYLNKNQMFSGEYYTLGLFSLLGMMVLVSAQHLLVLYIGLELFSLPVYAMVAMQRKSANAGEAALKYFIMGAIASGILLYGISIIYGLTGSLMLADIYKFTAVNNPAFILSLVFICVGIAFKFGAAPFHMWVPDVYEGAPTPVAMFIAAAPKLAAFGMAIRVFHETFANASDIWVTVLLVISVVSIFWGNIAAIAQSNLKRLLAYSGINHMGFVLLGFVAAGSSDAVVISQGYSASLFYVIVYSITVLAAFGFIMMLSSGDSKLELKSLDDYKGLYYKQPWFALLLMMLLFSMAGVPPFIGFFAKLSIIQSTIAAEYFYAAIFAVLMSVVGAFYYLRLIWLMFFEEPVGEIFREDKTISLDLKILVSINCLLVLFLGLYGQWLLAWCASVF